MPDRDRVCLECGHSYAWHQRERAERMLGSDPGMERGCYRRIGSQSCACPGFRGGNERIVAAPSMGGNLLKNGILTLLLVVMGLALLYVYRSQSPAIQTVPITQAVQDIQAGRVKAVTIIGSRATLELVDGSMKQTNLPDGAGGADPLSQAVSAYNQANPTHPIQLRYEQTDPGFSVIGSVLLSLLPVLLIGGFFFFMMRQARSRRDD